MLNIALILAAIALVQARSFNNPILSDQEYFDPRAIKVNGTYYIVAKIGDASTGQFPIHSSTDLINWKLSGYIFDESNVPLWAGNVPLINPCIHKIGNNYIIYFSVPGSEGSAIGVASAPDPSGPYTSTDRPILRIPNEELYYPNIIEAEDKIYLVWMSKTRLGIYARQLNLDGVSFFSNQTRQLWKPTSAVEQGGYIDSAWYMQRGNYHYLWFSPISSNSVSNIYVARSSQPMGPYESLYIPLFNSNTSESPQHASVIKDLDEKNDLIFYGDTDTKRFYSVYLASIAWGTDDWPYVEETSSQLNL